MTSISPAFVQEIDFPLTVPDAFQALNGLPDLLLFDSAQQQAKLGRYSFLMADPLETFVLDKASYSVDPFEDLRERMQQFRTVHCDQLPPFQGGAAGLLSYELGGCFEKLPSPRWDDLHLPVMVVGIYDWVIVWDHQTNRCWFISQGFPEPVRSRQEIRGRERWEQVHAMLTEKGSQLARREEILLTNENPEWPFAAPGVPVDSQARLFSNFDRDHYLQAVSRVIEYIRAGDLFQANLSQRLSTPAQRHSVDQYLLLRDRNPAPFAGYFAHDDWAILSSSPERFLEVRGREVRTRPIKGTRQRKETPEADLYTRDELRESEKDRAENVMIVDLLRNDLSRVCQPGTVRVPELCMVEAYETVSHLVSEVSGQLRSGATFWDLIPATFPGGSITGAPKIRAMEIITEIEQIARGPYCGSLFYCGFDGTADSSILIRTMVQRNGWLHFPTGGGIVVQSDPVQELEETQHKASGMQRSLMP